MTYRFSLQKYKDRDKSLLCPRCGRKNCFTPYVDNMSGEIVDPTVGICNHKHSCGYHLTPKEFFAYVRHYNTGIYHNSETNMNADGNMKNGACEVKKTFSDYGTPYNNRKRTFSFMQGAAVSPMYLSSVGSNAYIAKKEDYPDWFHTPDVHYITYETMLRSPFKSSVPEFVRCRFKEHTGRDFYTEDNPMPIVSGGSGHLTEALLRKGFSLQDLSDANERLDVCAASDYSTLYYQVDLTDGIRTAKIIDYDSLTAHRVKQKGASWLHSELIKQGYLKQNFTLRQVPFGLRNLRNCFLFDKNIKIAVYEAEKTAYIMCLINKGGFVHAALGGKDLLKADMLLPFKQLGAEKLILYPDKGCYALWQEKANGLSVKLNIDISVNKYLETTSLSDGSDLADLVLRRC